MKDFRKLLFCEAYLVVVFIIVWSFVLNNDVPVDAGAAVTIATFVAIIAAIAVAATATTISTVIAALIAATIAASAAAAAIVTAAAIAAGFAATIATFATAIVFATIAATIIVIIAAASGLHLRHLPVGVLVAVEFTAIFLLLSFGYWAIAVVGIAVLLGMGLLPERLVVRPVSASS